MVHLPIVSNLIRGYEAAIPNADPRTRNWVLLWNSPVYVWALSVMYLFSVWIGPKIMANREPLKLRSFLVIYNLSLVILSLYMAFELGTGAYHAGYNLVYCNGYNEETKKNPAEMRVASVLWWYFFSKVIEFMDTILMIVRKKNNQITFLHVYHHVTMLNIWWWVMVFIPGGLSCFGAFINMIVHVAMYLYYGLSAIPFFRKYLWWKRYLTMFQLIQFVLNLTHSSAMLITPCDFPLWGKVLLVSYMVSLLVLFSNFYIRSYRRPKRPLAATAGTKDGVSVTYDKMAEVNGRTAEEVNGLTKRHINATVNESE